MDFNITNFNERLKSIKLRELIVAGIGAIILGVILSEIFPAIYDSDDLYFVVITILILVFFIYTLKGTYGLKTNIHSVFETENQKEIKSPPPEGGGGNQRAYRRHKLCIFPPAVSGRRQSRCCVSSPQQNRLFCRGPRMNMPFDCFGVTMRNPCLHIVIEKYRIRR